MKKLILAALILAAFLGGRETGKQHVILNAEIETAPYLAFLTIDGETHVYSKEER